MTQEVLKLALEALTIQSDRVTEIGKQREAITAIKEALRENAMREVQRLGQEIEQEPVVGITAIRTWFKDGRVVTQTLCNSWVDTTPPQRTWVGLTDEEMTHTNHHMVEGAYQYSFKQGAKWAEAKLKQKNTHD
jgi:hypothetical protein